MRAHAGASLLTVVLKQDAALAPGEAPPSGRSLEAVQLLKGLAALADADTPSQVRSAQGTWKPYTRIPLYAGPPKLDKTLCITTKLKNGNY